MEKNIGGGYVYNESDSSASYDDEGFSVEALNDVEVTNPENGQALVYDSSSEKWVNGSTGLPAVTPEDIGKALMVQEVKQFITIVPAQNITFPVAPDPENPQFVDIEVQAENSNLLVAGGVYRQTIIDGGDTFVDYVVAEEDDGRLWVGEFINKNLETGRVYASGSETQEEPYQLVISLDKETTPAAEWVKEFPVMISKGTRDADTGVYTFDKTYNDVVSALHIMPVIFITDNEEVSLSTSKFQFFADYAYIQNRKYYVHLINNNDKFMSATADGFLTWDPG